jgi:transcriptional regulator GlxA family with amidase domain
VHLGKAGILHGRRFTTTVKDEYPEAFEGATYVDEDIVEDGNVITAWPNALADLAIIIGDRLGMFKDQADHDMTVRIFKCFQRG